MGRRAWTAAVAAAMIVVLAACGSERVGPVVAATAASAAVSPGQRAAADAASMPAGFRPPPGASRTGPLTVAVLAQVGQPLSPDLVTRTRWYRVPGKPLGGPVAADGPGQVAIPVDAQVLWLPAKPAAERIPAAAKVVTITHVPGSGPRSPARPWPVVTAKSGGCGAVAVTIGGRPMPTLDDAPSLQQAVEAVAGLRWPAGQLQLPGGPTTPAPLRLLRPHSALRP